MKPRCESCKPQGHHTPSGYAWYHEPTCDVAAGRKVGSVGEARKLHPAGTARAGTNPKVAILGKQLETWFQDEPGCMCPDCLYVEHWIDRDDDFTEAEL